MKQVKKINDEDLQKILDVVGLEYLEKQRSESWEAKDDWNDIFSTGEKQKIAIGRLIYHKP